jgi:D-psicose/D-tagatose/L-ribulose 3-epimerase
MIERPRLAVSNIAWEPSEDAAVGDVLRREGVAGAEIAPTKWREKPFEASAADVAAYRRSWEDRGLHVVSLQALLFGRPDLQLFASAESRALLRDYLLGVIDFAAAVGAHALVFGSPKNRVRGALPMSDATAIAAEFLRHLGAHCAERGAALCVEANPVEYGCDFVTTTAEAVALCRSVNHPAVRVNVDLGGITLSRENAATAIASARDVIGHYHASEPNLSEIGAASPHAEAGRALGGIDYANWVSIEMRAGGDHVAAVARAIAKVKASYPLLTRASG